MITDDDAPQEKAVQVTLPDEPVTEVEISDSKAKIEETSAKIEPVSTKREEPDAPDPREKALNDLRAQYEHQRKIAEAEREARKQAEQFAQQQRYQAEYAQNQVQGSNLAIIDNAIHSTEQAAAGAERDYAEAMAAGDYAAAAKAQRAIAQAESHLLQLQNGRARLQEQLQETTEGSVKQQPPSFEPQVPPAPQMDPVEMYAQRLTPKSAQWLREHPEVVSKIGRLTRAHEDAVEDGIQPESREYFRYIEARLGYSNQEDEAPAARVQKKSIASTPVSSTANGISSRPNNQSNVMTLRPDEVEMAILAEPDLPRDKAIESYARNKAFLIKQGKLTA